jgi:hypothetical protein
MNHIARITLVIFLFLLGIAIQPVRAAVFQDDFEAGWGNWHVDNGIWDIGTPSAGPEACHSGVKCAGTILDGNYLPNTDSRLISPSIRLSEVSGDEEIHLRFWHWFSYAGSDVGYAQISVYDETTEQWSSWETIVKEIVSISPIWTPVGADLTKYAGQKIKIAFYHTAHQNHGESSGWYIDDIEITGVSPSSCPPGDCYTQADLDAAVEAGRQECINDPASCGIIVSGGSCTPEVLEAAREEGRQECRSNPALCGIGEGEVVHATYTFDGKFHIPAVDVPAPFPGQSPFVYEVWMELVPSLEDFQFRLTGVELVE